jgi:hypothetical protein
MITGLIVDCAIASARRWPRMRAKYSCDPAGEAVLAHLLAQFRTLSKNLPAHWRNAKNFLSRSLWFFPPRT